MIPTQITATDGVVYLLHIDASLDELAQMGPNPKEVGMARPAGWPKPAYSAWLNGGRIELWRGEMDVGAEPVASWPLSALE